MAKEIPKPEHVMKKVQAAAHCLTEAAENGGPMIFARIGMMQASTGTGSGNSPQAGHWGRRKLRRDE
jgi:hypothetical protein